MLSDADFSTVVSKVRTHRPSDPRPTATGLSGWVFYLDKGRRETDGEAKRLGKKAEPFIGHRSGVLATLPRGVQTTANDWELIFRDPIYGNRKIFTASVFRINGENLRCVPDVVLRHKPSGTILVLENKVTKYAIYVPAEGWPNLVTQLWCYAWIDDWLDAPEVILAGSIYRWENGTIKRTEVTPRATRSDLRLNQICVRIFKAYGGRINIDALKHIKIRNALRRLLSE